MKNKWSNKHIKCIWCWTVEKKHKAKWFCTTCYNRHQLKTSSVYREKINKSKYEWYQKNKTTDKYKETQKKQQIKFYSKNKEAIRVIEKTKRMQKQWKKCLEIFFKWKRLYLPFETLEKPGKTENDMKIYHKWKQKLKQFDTLRKYYNEKTK